MQGTPGMVSNGRCSVPGDSFRDALCIAGQPVARKRAATGRNRRDGRTAGID